MIRFALGYICGAASVILYGQEITQGLRNIANMIERKIEQ